jgi:hypothetical protein
MKEIRQSLVALACQKFCLFQNLIFQGSLIIMIDGRRSTLRRLFMKGQERYDLYLRSRYMLEFYGYDPGYYLYHSFMVLENAAKTG